MVTPAIPAPGLTVVSSGVTEHVKLFSLESSGVYAHPSERIVHASERTAHVTFFSAHASERTVQSTGLTAHASESTKHASATTASGHLPTSSSVERTSTGSPKHKLLVHTILNLTCIKLSMRPPHPTAHMICRNKSKPCAKNAHQHKIYPQLNTQNA